MNTFEYIWLDGYQPEPFLRSKVKATDQGSAPDWSFDGSSTNKQRVEVQIVFYYQYKHIQILMDMI